MLNGDVNEFGYQLVKPEETFKFTCTLCGECCRNVKNSIMLEPLDVYRLARFLGVEMGDVLLKYTETSFLSWWFPIFLLKTKFSSESCCFLKSSRCTVQTAKPRACRLYPLGIGPENTPYHNWPVFIV